MMFQECGLHGSTHPKGAAFVCVVGVRTQGLAASDPPSDALLVGVAYCMLPNHLYVFATDLGLSVAEVQVIQGDNQGQTEKQLVEVSAANFDQNRGFGSRGRKK